MPNSIHNLDTKMFENENGKFPAIVMGLNIPEADSAEAFIDHVIQQFKNQRMCSPPETANMVITLSGCVSAEQFCNLWIQRYSNDTILTHFMSMMAHADILHISGTTLLDRASLISAET